MIDAQYIFVTHAHLDHIGRLPMLVSGGFKGKIIMTPATKALSYASLIDSAKVMQQNYDGKIEERKRKGKILADISRYTQFEKNEKRTQEETDKMRELEQEYGQEKIQRLQEALQKVDGNISQLLPDVQIPLYTQEDVNILFGVSSVSDTKKKKSISGKKAQHRDIVAGNLEIFDDQTVTEGGVVENDQSALPTVFIQTCSFGEEMELSLPKNGKKLDGVGLSIQKIVTRFLPAGHILGSAQLEVQIGVEKILKGAQVDIAYSRREQEDYKLLFGGDMGRFDTGNNIGAPDLPNGQYLYREMEGTYANKDHPERDEAIAKLFSILQSSGKHILLPNFSLQRTPDMLLLLLDYVEQICIPQKNNFVKRNRELKVLIQRIYKTISGEDNQDLITHLESEKMRYEEEMIKNGEKIDKMDITIISDSSLTQTILPTYISENPEIYGALTEEAQKRRFQGNVIIKYPSVIESKEYFSRYTLDAENPALDRRTKIIVSSGGMCEGGPVIGHLQRMVEKPNYDIIFTGYAPENSLAGKLKSADAQIIIEGEIYEVNARVHDIIGFSGHAGASELTQWHNAGRVIKGGVDAIVHGGDARFALAHKLGKSHKNAGVVCPQLGDTIKIKFPTQKTNNRKVRV